MAKLTLELSHDDIINYITSRLEGLNQFVDEPEIKYTKKLGKLIVVFKEE